MEIIRVEEKERWNRVIKEFDDWDIYYLNEYARTMQIHGDGEPNLIYHEKAGAKIAYVMMKNDIADMPVFSARLPKEKFFDWTTPYGYGGPLTKGRLSETWLCDFYEELQQFSQKNTIVSQFFRFHPLLQNQWIMENISEIAQEKKTVYVDTHDKEMMLKNMTPNNRNMVRKAKRNGIKIIYDQGERVEEFQKIYESTMRRNQAQEYYYFKKEYFEYLINEMRDHTIFFYAIYQGIPVSASIFFYNERYMHYHLSGTLEEYRGLAAANLLLSEAADWANEHGIRKLHLGGGVRAEDSLLAFKKHFNRNGLLDFYIGRNIFMPDAYHELVELRADIDAEFDRSKPFMIKYRG